MPLAKYRGKLSKFTRALFNRFIKSDLSGQGQSNVPIMTLNRSTQETPNSKALEVDKTRDTTTANDFDGWHGNRPSTRVEKKGEEFQPAKTNQLDLRNFMTTQVC